MAVGGRLSQSWHAFAAAFRNPELRQLQLAGLGSTLAVWVNSIAIAVYAYRADGAKAVGIVLFVRWTLAALAAPWLGVFADRVSRRRVMLAVDFSRSACVAGMTVTAALGGPPLAAYALAVVVSVVSSAFGPAQAALIPTLAETPDELTASNLALNTISGASTFAGPALGGVALAVSGPWLVFAIAAAGYLWSGLCVLRLSRDAPAQGTGRSSFTSELVAGFAAIGADRKLQVLTALVAAQMLVVGALEIVIVVDAIRVLRSGNSAVGWLNTGLGGGGLLGAALGIVLAARKRLAGDFGLGLILMGAALTVLGLSSSFTVALVLFAVMGVGGTLIDVTGVTLLQRTAPADVVGRVFGVLESVMLASVAVGALVMPLLIAATSPRTAFAAAGLILPVGAVAAWRVLARVDREARVAVEPLELLRAISIFAPLPAPLLERLASLTTETRVATGAAVFRQGDAGDRFYVIADGTAAVDIDDAATRILERGDFFGEIALLRDVPRTATVRADAPLRLYALERDDFIGAVTGYAPSREAADRIVAARLPALS